VASSNFDGATSLARLPAALPPSASAIESQASDVEVRSSNCGGTRRSLTSRTFGTPVPGAIGLLAQGWVISVDDV